MEKNVIEYMKNGTHQSQTNRRYAYITHPISSATFEFLEMAATDLGRRIIITNKFAFSDDTDQRDVELDDIYLDTLKRTAGIEKRKNDLWLMIGYNADSLLSTPARPARPEISNLFQKDELLSNFGIQIYDNEECEILETSGIMQEDVIQIYLPTHRTKKVLGEYLIKQSTVAILFTMIENNFRSSPAESFIVQGIQNHMMDFLYYILRAIYDIEQKDNSKLFSFYKESKYNLNKEYFRKNTYDFLEEITRQYMTAQQDLQRTFGMWKGEVITEQKTFFPSQKEPTIDVKNIQEQMWRIKNHPKVETAHFKTNRMEIITKSLIIEIEYEGRVRYFKIGTVGIRIYYKLGTPQERIQLFDPEPEAPEHTFLHPHSRSFLCLGNMNKTLRILFNQNEYDNVVATMILYLESVNLSDPWGRSIFEWPEVDRGGQPIK